MALVLFNGIGHACAVLVGNQIGAGDEEQAFRYAARSEVLGMVGAVGIGSLVLASANSILSLYNVSPTVIDYAHHVLTILGIVAVAQGLQCDLIYWHLSQWRRHPFCVYPGWGDHLGGGRTVSLRWGFPVPPARILGLPAGDV